MKALKDVEWAYTCPDRRKLRRSPTYEMVLAFRHKKTKKLIAIDDNDTINWIASHIR